MGLADSMASHASIIKDRELTRTELWYLNVIAAILAYSFVYVLCGFVPMGYVDGSSNLLATLAPSGWI